jgi:hypothetical protein
MACILHNDTQDLFKSMALQIELEKKEKECIVKQLQNANDKLDRVRKMLDHKDQIINSLEIDLMHLINQVEKLQSMTKAEQ